MWVGLNIVWQQNGARRHQFVTRFTVCVEFTVCPRETPSWATVGGLELHLLFGHHGVRLASVHADRHDAREYRAVVDRVVLGNVRDHSPRTCVPVSPERGAKGETLPLPVFPPLRDSWLEIRHQHDACGVACSARSLLAGVGVYWMGQCRCFRRDQPGDVLADRLPPQAAGERRCSARHLKRGRTRR